MKVSVLVRKGEGSKGPETGRKSLYFLIWALWYKQFADITVT